MTKHFEGKTVLVTGAGGFIGSHLVENLVRQGALVKAFVHYNSRSDPGLLRFISQETKSNIEIISGDLADTSAVGNAIEGCQIVFHLGALISIPYSYRHPLEVVKTNVLGTMNVLLACREKHVERLIHTSTSEVYGTAITVPISESHPLQGQSPYSASKIGADKLAESFYCTYDLPVVTVRPFNTYGPRQSARAVIPTVITQALTLGRIRLGNLNTTRDFTFVQDTVNGFIRAALADGVEGKTFNLGTSHEISIGELAHLIIQKVGRPVELVVEKERLRPEKSEVFQLLADTERAKAALDWQPETTLSEGLDITIEWIKNNLDLYHIGEYQF